MPCTHAHCYLFIVSSLVPEMGKETPNNPNLNKECNLKKSNTFPLTKHPSKFIHETYCFTIQIPITHPYLNMKHIFLLFKCILKKPTRRNENEVILVKLVWTTIKVKACAFLATKFSLPIIQ